MSKPHIQIESLLSTVLIGLLIFSSVPLTANAASKRPSIKLTAPSSKSVFAKEGSGIIPIAWETKNVPEDTLVVLELQHKKLTNGGVGGGTWQQEILAGDSTGTYNWDIQTEGTADPGTYKIRAVLQACVPGDCSKNPSFPGTKKTKVYAKSKWINLTVAKSAKDESEEAARTIGTRPSGEVFVTLAMEGAAGDFFNLSAESEPTFLYYPSGDVESCTITGYYQGGKRPVTHGWKNSIRPGVYGRATFSAVEPYPYKALQSVEVVCGNAAYRASDTIRFSVSASEEAEYKILIGTSGRSTYKKGAGSKIDAEAYCAQAYNDPEIHKFTRVQCYWDGQRFEDVRSFKG